MYLAFDVLTALLIWHCAVRAYTPLEQAYPWPMDMGNDNWITDTVGAPPTWDWVHQSVKCRQQMSQTMVNYQRPCGGDRAQQHPCNMRVLIVTAWRGSVPYDSIQGYDFTVGAVSLLRKYCNRWGFCDVQAVYLSAMERGVFSFKGRHPGWNKIKVMESMVRSGVYNWYMWVDTDTTIINHAYDLRWLINLAGPEKHLLISHDMWRSDLEFYACTGVWLVRNSTESLKLLHEWWNLPDRDPKWNHTRTTFAWEQAALNMDWLLEIKDQVLQYPWCYLSDHPWYMTDRPFLAHLWKGPSKVERKHLEKQWYNAFHNMLTPDLLPV